MCRLQINYIREKIKTQINNVASLANGKNGLKNGDNDLSQISEIQETKQTVKSFFIENFYSEDIKLLGHYLTSDNVLFMSVELPPNGVVKEHKHSSYEKIMVLTGSYVDETSGESFVAGDRQVLLPGMAHSMKTNEGCVLNIIRSNFPL